MNYKVVESHSDAIVRHGLQNCKPYRRPYGLQGDMRSNKGEHAEDHMSFKGRIRAAMTRQGWPTSRDGRDIAVVVLRTKWKDYFKGAKDAPTPSRPAFYDWLGSDKPRISPKNLFLLSDLLNVNARWLATRERGMSKPIYPDDEIQPLIDAWGALNPAAREELVREANKLLRVQGVPSAANPFNNLSKSRSK
jgi:hypothetical protein